MFFFRNNILTKHITSIKLFFYFFHTPSAPVQSGSSKKFNKEALQMRKEMMEQSQRNVGDILSELHFDKLAPMYKKWIEPSTKPVNIPFEYLIYGRIIFIYVFMLVVFRNLIFFKLYYPKLLSDIKT